MDGDSGDNEFLRFMAMGKQLLTDQRFIRLRLDHSEGVSDDALLPQRVVVSEAMCVAVEAQVQCVSTCASVQLKELIALPAAIDFVTDRGDLRSVAGIVVEASAGGSDGAIASYQLVLRDAMTVMEKRINTRVFRNVNEFEVVQVLLDEWRQSNAVLAGCFEYEVDEHFELRATPRREFIMQHNESDAAFIRRLLKRSGIAWYFRAGRSRTTAVDPFHDAVPAHTLVMFNNADTLKDKAFGSVRYNNELATQERDTITAWTAVRTLQPGAIGRHSWDYKNPLGTQFMAMEASSGVNQGYSGNELAATLNDYQVQMPHAGEDHEDLCRLGQLRMTRYDYESKCFHAEAGTSGLPLGGYFSLDGHPEIDTHPAAEREFIVTSLHLTAQNNLPKALAARVERLFARNRWAQERPAGQYHAALAEAVDAGSSHFHLQFTAVRCGISIVPAYDARVDLPQTTLMSAIVVGPPNEEVFCDKTGRVRLRMLGTRAQDHRHANGAGASDSDTDSAWVRSVTFWAGPGSGSLHQCGGHFPLRTGTEVLVAFVGGDPDKPAIIGQMYNQNAQPPALSNVDDLPGNRYLSGIKSREIGGQRANQLRFDDGNGQISAQLSSDHGATQLNLGYLTQPKAEGHGEPRGEGAELRSDHAVAVRGAQGVLISADARGEAMGGQLDRDELLGIAAGFQTMAEQLCKLAVTHAQDASCGPQLAQLVDKLRHLHQGSNVAPSGSGGGGGEAIVAVSGPAGVIVAGGQNLALGGAVNVDLVSGDDTNLSAGGSTLVRAAYDISLFTNQNDIKLTAAAGKMQLQAQDNAMELLARKVLSIMSTTDWITLTAKKGVRINGGGTEVVISAEGIKGYTAGKHEMYAADHQTFPPQSKEVEFPGSAPCPSKAGGAAKTGDTSAPAQDKE